MRGPNRTHKEKVLTWLDENFNSIPTTDFYINLFRRMVTEGVYSKTTYWRDAALKRYLERICILKNKQLVSEEFIDKACSKYTIL